MSDQKQSQEQDKQTKAREAKTPEEQQDDMGDPTVGGTPQRPETEEEYQERMKQARDEAEKNMREGHEAEKAGQGRADEKNEAQK